MNNRLFESYRGYVCVRHVLEIVIDAMYVGEHPIILRSSLTLGNRDPNVETLQLQRLFTVDNDYEYRRHE